MSAGRYRISSYDVKKLAGKSFSMKNRASSTSVRFQVTADQVRAGKEGYGVCVDCFHPDGTVPSFLKIFKFDVPERHGRNRFLRDLGMAKRHWLFSALPYGYLPRTDVEGTAIVGNVSKRILGRDGQQARDISQFIDQGEWNFTDAERRRFGGQLCCAIVALEGLDMVHGDLSLGNVLLGHDAKDGDVAVLCDYDGFYHPSQRLLPLEQDKKQIRIAGTAGFLYPQLLEEIDASKPDVCVQTDRFALGALICQMMVWQADTADQLQRWELVDQEISRSRDLGGLPAAIRQRWPEGFDLLQQALTAPTIQEMPGPRTWLSALGGPQPRPARPPLLTVRNRRLKIEDVKFNLKSASGNLGRGRPELAKVDFSRTGSDVELHFKWSEPVFRKSRTKLEAFKLTQENPVRLRPGDSAMSNCWECW